jgi:metal-responsive CopG/Arc/MetJ family transcriptional regulator
MIRVDHNLREDQVEFLKEHKLLDRSEHIRRALDAYISRIKKQEIIISPSKSASKTFKKGELYGDNEHQSSSSEKY